MEVHYLIVAKYAEQTKDGFLTLVGGGIDLIRVAAFPFNFPSLFVTGKVTLNREEASVDHALKLLMLAPDDSQLLETDEMPAHGHEMPADRQYFNINFTLGFNNLSFLLPGLYRFQLLYDGEPVKVAPFRLELSPTPQEATDAPAEAE